MEIYNDRTYTVEEKQSSVFSSLMRKVYVWMTLALCVTGLTALYVSNNHELMTAIFSSRILFYGLMIGEVAMVWILSASIYKMSFFTAASMFVLYSILNGVTMSFIFLAFTVTSIATTFFITAGTFAAMAIVGYTTKKDLSGWGRYLFMALIGLIIATIVNIFVASTALDWIISYIGIFIFVGLTAYDSQKIKSMIMTYGTEVNDSTQKLALMGSLNLYLDFINLFLYLLRIFGRNK